MDKVQSSKDVNPARGDIMKKLILTRGEFSGNYFSYITTVSVWRHLTRLRYCPGNSLERLRKTTETSGFHTVIVSI
jgi:hypothetical protein